MNSVKQRNSFRAILEGKRCIHPASVFDPISARLAADVGFEALMLAGSVASLTVLGAPDLTLVTLTEFSEQIRRITRAASLPLLVDADHGFGNALNVMRTVEELEVAGIAALTIEDTALPSGFGQNKRSQLTSIEEGVGKMRAALMARTDPSLAIVGRTSAAVISTLDDAIARGAAYAAAGVDAMFFPGIKSRGQLEAIAKAIDVPIMLGGTSGEIVDPAYLADMGVRICLLGHQPFAAAVEAVHATLKALYSSVDPQALPGVASAALMKAVSRESDYARWTKDYLAG